MRIPGIVRFIMILTFCTLLRFYLGEDSINFLWFIILYLPIINWVVYGFMSSIRLGLNKLKQDDWITVVKLRRFYIWYLSFPGAVFLAELIYRGYIFNR